MKRFLFFIFYFLFFTDYSNAQELYYQNTFKGGASFDGKTYVSLYWQNPDTILFQNSVPAGCTLKKAFLISYRGGCVYNHVPAVDYPIHFKYNNQTIQFDSSDIATPAFLTRPNPLNAIEWMSVKDVTSLTLNSNNKLITARQDYGANECDHYFFYPCFYLLLLYENNSYSNVNVALFLNTQTHVPAMTYALINLNPINTANDVGLSIESIDDNAAPYLQYQLSSTTNTVTLGTLRQQSLDGSTDYTTGLGSFHYENGILSGLVDDSPDAFIDTTDALANIKTYLPNNAASFTLNTTSSTAPAINGNDATTAHILAYSTPCPSVPAGADSIKIYKLCKGQNIQLNATSGYSNYSWYPTADLNNANIANPILNAQNTANYICYVKDAAGCLHTEQTQVIVHPPPAPKSITTTTAICGSTQGVLTITPNYHHYGFMYNLNNGALQADTVYNNLSAGHYTLTITDNFNCIYKDTFSIVEVNLAKAVFYPTPTSGCEPLSVFCINFSNNVYNVTNAYVWYVNNDSATTTNFNYTFTDTGKYTITLLAYETLRRCSAVTTQTVLVKDCPPDSIKIIVPNVFSPNADGINDVWQLIVYNFNYTVNNYECLIYDRWGIKVFEANSISEAWGGRTTSGMPSSAGAYYYIIKLTATNSKGVSEQKDFKGYLELVR
jgi:gliding motility-associated-like protein